MKIILTGAPGSGKNSIAQELAKELNLTLLEGMEWATANPDVELGSLSDYRVEIGLGSERMTNASKPGVHARSLIDSVAHIGVRINQLEPGVTHSARQAQRWSTTALLLAIMLVDSFQHDLIFFIAGNDGSSFTKSIEIATKKLLDECGYTYIELTDAKEAAKLVREYEQRRIDTDIGEQTA